MTMNGRSFLGSQEFALFESCPDYFLPLRCFLVLEKIRMSCPCTHSPRFRSTAQRQFDWNNQCLWPAIVVICGDSGCGSTSCAPCNDFTLETEMPRISPQNHDTWYHRSKPVTMVNTPESEESSMFRYSLTHSFAMPQVQMCKQTQINIFKANLKHIDGRSILKPPLLDGKSPSV